MEHGHIMADIDYVEALLELCDNYDIAMIEANGVKVVFNPALGPMPEDTVPTESEPGEEGDTYTRLMNGEPPKFNNE